MNVSLIEAPSRAAVSHWKPEYPARVALLRDANKRALCLLWHLIRNWNFVYTFQGTEHNFYMSLTTQFGRTLHFPENENISTVVSNLFFRISLGTYVYTHTISSSSCYYYRISHFSASAGKHSPILGYVINRNRLDGLIYNLKSFLQLNMFQELQIFAFVCTYSDAG
jgi:hypothetical protein